MISVGTTDWACGLPILSRSLHLPKQCSGSREGCRAASKVVIDRQPISTMPRPSCSCSAGAHRRARHVYALCQRFAAPTIFPGHHEALLKGRLRGSQQSCWAVRAPEWRAFVIPCVTIGLCLLCLTNISTQTTKGTMTGRMQFDYRPFSKQRSTYTQALIAIALS